MHIFRRADGGGLRSLMRLQAFSYGNLSSSNQTLVGKFLSHPKITPWYTTSQTTFSQSFSNLAGHNLFSSKLSLKFATTSKSFSLSALANLSSSSSSSSSLPVRRRPAMKKKDKNSGGGGGKKGAGEGDVSGASKGSQKRQKNDQSDRTKNFCAHLQVMSVGQDVDAGLSPSVLLFFDSHRFLFNAAEGLQRFTVEHQGFKLARIENIFLTRITGESTGGLPGGLLTLSDLGEPQAPLSVTLYGCSQVWNLRNVLSRFVLDKNLKVQYKQANTEQPAEPLLKNEAVTITPIVLRPSSSSATVSDSQEENSEDVNPPSSKRQRVEEDEEHQHHDHRGSFEGDSVCYLAEMKPIAGKFDLERALALGVPKGPLFGKLQRGESVTLESGRVVGREDVCAATIPGPLVLIVDCPDVRHVASLMQAPLLQRYYTGHQPPAEDQKKEEAKKEEESETAVSPLTCVVHLTPAHVTCSPEYLRWITSLSGGSDIQHIMVSGAACDFPVTTHLAASTLQARTHCIHPGIFPGFPPAAVSSDSQLRLSDALAVMTEKHGLKVARGHNLLKFILRPVSNQGLDSSAVLPDLSLPAVRHQLFQEIPQLHSEVEALRRSESELKAAEENELSGDTKADTVGEPGGNFDRDVAELVFLGTGAAIPSKYRNVSSIFLDIKGQGGLLMDTGEGCLSQLHRRYGGLEMQRILRELQCAWISHIHADHHAGLVSVLKARQKLLGSNCPPLVVIGPRPLLFILERWDSIEPLSYTFVDARHTAEGGMQARQGRFMGSGAAGRGAVEEALSSLAPEAEQKRVEEAAKMAIGGVTRSLGLTKLLSVDVIHCSQAFALVIEHERGWKLVYSGDTRPSAKLAKAAENATVLIHEATFEDGLLDEALAKKHSTTQEAIQTGKDSKAYRTILTHFSQRYPKIPLIDESYTAKTCIAFDLMSVNFADLKLLPKVLPSMKYMFADEALKDNEDGNEVDE